MIIEYPKSLHRPRRNMDVEYQVTIEKIDDDVLKRDDFDEWLSYKVAEVGAGTHTEYMLGDTPDEDYLVKFHVVVTVVSITDWSEPNLNKPKL